MDNPETTIIEINGTKLSLRSGDGADQIGLELTSKP